MFARHDDVDTGVSVLRLDGDAVLIRRLRRNVDEALAAEASGADSNDDRRLVTRADDHVVRLGRAVDEIPGLERALLLLDDQHAPPREDEKSLLRRLAVVEADALSGLQHGDVDPELPKRPLALEVAPPSEALPLAPASVPRVHDEPAVDVRDQAELGLPERRLGHALRLRRALSDRDECFDDGGVELGPRVPAELGDRLVLR